MYHFNWNSVDIGDEAVHASTGTEFAFFNEVDCILDRATIWCNEKWLKRFFDDIHLGLNSSSKC